MASKTVVVIDDEPFIRDIISRKLTGAGFKVHTACDGIEGLELVRMTGPCLLITDFKMPRMNGLEVCAACREDPETRELPIIVVTGSLMTTANVQTELKPLGNIFCLSKPFSPREMLDMVQEIVAMDSPKGD